MHFVIEVLIHLYDNFTAIFLKIIIDINNSSQFKHKLNIISFIKTQFIAVPLNWTALHCKGVSDIVFTCCTF